MHRPPTITFRGIDHSPTLERDIRARIDKLETYYGAITGCRVLVEPAQRHHETGNRYHVRIAVSVPGDDIVVAHEPSLHASAQAIELPETTRVNEPDPQRKHVLVAIREAFDIARRRLQDYARQQRGAVKTAAQQSQGCVSRFFPIDEYGYIETEDGREVYFQKSSVLKDGFDHLAVGNAVSFVEEAGEKGPQASTVRMLHPSRRSAGCASAPQRESLESVAGGAPLSRRSRRA